MPAAQGRESLWTTWLIVTLIVLYVLLRGLFVLLVVGDLGQPGWDYRPVRDVPGESAYGIYAPAPEPQHIKGKGGA